MSSLKPLRTDKYTPIAKAFCDGFEVRLNSLPTKDVINGKESLINTIHAKVPNLRIRNIKITNRDKTTYAWITLKPETSRLNPRMLTELMKIVKVIKDHLMVTWDLGDDELDDIRMTKLDVT